MQIIQLMGAPSVDSVAKLFGARPNKSERIKPDPTFAQSAPLQKSNGRTEEVDPNGQKAQLVALDLIAGLTPPPSIDLKDLKLDLQVGKYKVDTADLVSSLESAADQSGTVDFAKVSEWLSKKLGIPSSDVFINTLKGAVADAIEALSPSQTGEKVGPQCVTYNLGDVPVDDPFGAKDLPVRPMPRPFFNGSRQMFGSVPGHPIDVELRKLLQSAPSIDAFTQGQGNLGQDIEPFGIKSPVVQSQALKADQVDPTGARPQPVPLSAPAVSADQSAINLQGTKPLAADVRPVLDYLKKGGLATSRLNGATLEPNPGDTKVVIADGKITVSRPSPIALTPTNADEFVQKFADSLNRQSVLSLTGTKEQLFGPKPNILPIDRPILTDPDSGEPVIHADVSPVQSVSKAPSAAAEFSGSSEQFGEGAKSSLAADSKEEVGGLKAGQAEVSKTDSTAGSHHVVSEGTHAPVSRGPISSTLDRAHADVERAALQGMREVADAVQDILAAAWKSRRASCCG